MKKKLLALFLVLIMSVSLMPATAFAETVYETYIPTVEMWGVNEDGFPEPYGESKIIDLATYTELSGELFWTITDGADTGALLESDGSLVIQTGCMAGTVTIEVSDGEDMQTLKFDLLRHEPYCWGGLISSTYKMEVPQSGSVTQQHTVTIYDQYGGIVDPSAYEAYWFLIEEDDWDTEYKNYNGITIDDNGLVTVPAGTPSCNLRIKVRLDQWGDTQSCQNGLQIVNKHEESAVEIWDGTVAASFAGGSGTEDDPYLIANASQLALFTKDKFYNDDNFRLVADIYLNDVADWEDWTEENAPANIWVPPFYYSSYGGTFDGDGHTIYGLYTDATQPYQAFLYQINDEGCVKNLVIDKSKFFGTEMVSTIAARHFGVIEDCINRGSVQASDEEAGGIAAYCYSTGLIKNCINYGDVFSFEKNGGITGAIAGTIENCVNYMDIEGYCYVGGIAGAGHSGGIIRNCTNNGDITVLLDANNEDSGDSAGGIMGSTRGNDIWIDNCINNGDISGYTAIGGICGDCGQSRITECKNNGDVHAELYKAGGITGALYIVDDFECKIEFCVNTGTVSVGKTKDCYYAGGIVGDSLAREGYSSAIRNCYNTGKISGYLGIGGLAGNLRVNHTGSSALIENCFSVGEISGSSQVSGTVARMSASDMGAAAIVQNCYCLNTVSADIKITDNTGTNAITNVKALSKAEIGKQSSYEGFDFVTVWFIAGDGSYPVFRGAGEEGEMGDVLTYSYYENGGIIVTMDESYEESVYAIAVAYKDGKMVAMDMVELSAGEEGTLTLENWGQDVKLFAVSEDQTPLCEAEEL